MASGGDVNLVSGSFTNEGGGLYDVGEGGYGGDQGEGGGLDLTMQGLRSYRDGGMRGRDYGTAGELAERARRYIDERGRRGEDMSKQRKELDKLLKEISEKEPCPPPPCSTSADPRRQAFDGLVDPENPDQCPLAKQVGEAHALLDQCTRKLHQHASAQLDDVAETCERCDASCKGCVDAHCDQAEAAIAKACKRIDDDLVLKLSYCYNQLARYGVTFPTSEELQSAAGGTGRPLADEQPITGANHAPPAEDDYTPPADSAYPEPVYSDPTAPTPLEYPTERPTSPLPSSYPSNDPYAGSQNRPSNAGFGGGSDRPLPPANPPAKTTPGCQEIDLCRTGWLWWAAQWVGVAWRTFGIPLALQQGRNNGRPGDPGWEPHDSPFGRAEDGAPPDAPAPLAMPQTTLEEVS